MLPSGCAVLSTASPPVMSEPLPARPPGSPGIAPVELAPAARLPAAVKGLSLVSLFNDFASEMVYPLLPAFIVGTLGGGAALLGLLDGAADLTSAALKLASGRLADRPRWRGPLILGGYFTAVLVRPLMSVASAAWQVVGFRIIDRVGKGIRTPPRDALIAAVTPAPLRGRAFGFHRGADHFGAVLGSLAAWYLVAHGVGVRRVIEWSVLPGVIAFGVLAVVLRRPGGPPGVVNAGTVNAGAVNVGAVNTGVNAGAVNAGAANAGAVTAGAAAPATSRGKVIAGHDRALWAPVLALTALAFFRLPEALLLLRLQDTGVAVAVVPLVWAGLHVVRSASSYPGGWLSDRLGPRGAVAAGGLVFAGVALALGLARGPVTGVTAFLMLGLVAGLTESAERAMVVRLSPARTGRGFGLYHALTGLGALPAGVLFGWIYQAAGGPVALAVSAAGVLAGVGGWLAVSPRTAEAG
jgi:MFS family permease